MEKRPIHFIPLEITSLILARVPARSLLRFRYVCKSWCNLIDSLWFATNQVSIASLQPHIVIVPIVPPPTSYRSFTFKGKFLEESSSRSPILLFSYWPDPERWHHVGDVGFGLVCFQSSDRLGEAYLCNPLRRQVLVLPTVAVIDSNALRNRYGIGFDSATNAYKIVHVVSSKNADRIVAEVYTFGTKSLWRRISSSILHHIFHINCIYAHGDMHWTNHLPYNTFFQCGPITSFNFEKEEFKLTPHPDFGCKPAGHEKFLLTTLRGSLAVVHFVPPEETHVEIWVMKDYGNKVWVREYKISMINRPKWDLKRFGFSRFYIDGGEHEHHMVLLGLINILNGKRLYAISNHTQSVISFKHFGDLVANFRYRNFSLKTRCFFYVSPYMKMEQLQHYV